MEISINVTVGECNNLHSSKGGSFHVFTRVEFKDVILGESSRLEVLDGISCVDMGLKVSHVCNPADQAAVENLMRFPLFVSVFEVLPKDKKAKDEKSQLMGVASIDLLPLLKGEQLIKDTVEVHQLNLQPTEAEESLVMEINVEVSTDKPILSETDQEQGNILFLRVKGMYSLPDPVATVGAHTFTIATPSPCHLINSPDVLSIQGGEVRTSGSADIALANRKWKWPTVSPSNVGKASLISNSPLIPNAVEDEKGYMRSPDDIDFRRSAECTKPSVAWNTELRVLLPTKATSAFLASLSTCHIWPVEVVRILNIAGKGKSKDEVTLSHSGISYMDLSTLLYPGATKVFGAYPVNPVVESELGKKCTVIDKSLMMNIHKSTAAPTKSTGGGKRPGTSNAARQSAQSIASQGSFTDESAEGQAYLESKTYLLLEMELSKPLVPKRTACAIAHSISEYIPPRPAIPKRIGGAEKAIKDYHKSIVDVASLLLTDYRSLFGSQVSKDTLQNTREASEERRKSLIYHLNKSGHYHAYKEHLKKSVLALVRQKFINEASSDNEEQLQSFLSKLYTYLVDEMHQGLGQVFSLEESAPDPPTFVDCDKLRQYALESEHMQDLEMAEHYHKELLSREDHISLHWYEHGVYSLLKKDDDKAEECFKESIALDQKFVPALLLYGICCCLKDKYKEADEAMELATVIDDCNAIAWTIRGLCCELSGNTLLRDMCLQEAQKLCSKGKKKTYISVNNKPSTKKQAQKEFVEGQESEIKSQVISERRSTIIDQDHCEEAHPLPKEEGNSPLQDSLDGTEQQPAPTCSNEDNILEHDSHKDNEVALSKGDESELSPFLQTASYLLDVYAAKFAEMCLAHEFVLQSSKKKDFKSENGEPLIEKQNSLQQPEKRKSTLMKDEDENGITKETAESSVAADPVFISVHYDICMGRLCMLNGDFKMAETYLRRAVQKDILNSNALALLGDCLYLSGELLLAKDFYQRVVEYVNPPAHLNTVLLRLADIYMKHEEFSEAKFTYLRACRNSPSSVTWRGVGIACYMLQEYDNSEDALSEANILNNLDPVTWAYLSLLCMKTNRAEEASQAASFAHKTGLKDAYLLKLIPTSTL